MEQEVAEEAECPQQSVQSAFDPNPTQPLLPPRPPVPPILCHRAFAPHTDLNRRFVSIAGRRVLIQATMPPKMAGRWTEKAPAVLKIPVRQKSRVALDEPVGLGHRKVTVSGWSQLSHRHLPAVSA